MQIEFTIPGIPIAKKRPRFARRGKFVTTYNDQQTEEGRWLLSAREAFRREGLNEPLNVPVTLKMVFYMPIPASVSKKQRALMELNQAHTKKPDIDNLLKFSLDCLNGELFRDDSLVYAIRAVKRYAAIPITFITANWVAGIN